jgi:hypothetical protein
VTLEGLSAHLLLLLLLMLLLLLLLLSGSVMLVTLPSMPKKRAAAANTCTSSSTHTDKRHMGCTEAAYDMTMLQDVTRRLCFSHAAMLLPED